MQHNAATDYYSTDISGGLSAAQVYGPLDNWRPVDNSGLSHTLLKWKQS
jgi:hypothetical protein